jgi:DNA recombination protein RmuC
MCSLFVPVENPACRPSRPCESRKTRHGNRTPRRLGLVVGLAIAGLAIFVGRRDAGADPPRATAAERSPPRSLPTSASSNWRAGAADGRAARQAQTQLQSSVHERLDAVTPHLGTSMQTATKHTTDNLQKLNERLAVIDTRRRA